MELLFTELWHTKVFNARYINVHVINGDLYHVVNVTMELNAGVCSRRTTTLHCTVVTSK